jgi:acyl-CoA dehydrogenase
MDVDELGAIELAFAAYPAVEAIERRLRDKVKAHEIARMPQALPLLLDWADDAAKAALISDTEHEAIRLFVLHADKVIQVDDFPQDFDAAKGVASKQDFWRMRHNDDAGGHDRKQAAE